MKKWILAILTAVMLCGACAQADYQAGQAAEDAGLIELAFELWEEAAAQGDAEAAYQLGKRYYNGTYGEVDYAKAKEYFMAAAELGNHKAIRAIAIMYRYGNGVEQDIEKALEWHMKAAALGNGISMNNIGVIYRERGDYATAMEWYLKALDSGYDGMDGSPCTNIGHLYHEGWGVEQDYEKAMEWYLRGVQEGSAISAYNIGVMYRDGNGVEQDYEKAMEWFLRGAQAGILDSTFNVGMMYHNALGVEKDYAAAAQWWEKCLELDPDYLNALNWLGWIYQQNEYGMTPDGEKAYMYLERAAELGNAKSAYNIGSMYYHGEFVEKDYAMAAQWWEKALELDPDHLHALEWLGWIYRQNEYGVTPDAEKSEMYLQRAAELGSEYAAGLLSK